ncbi:hypothetical protein SESBI_47255 [Sesbania bispinosa]|nr:hypothetical protein SESBI_47255 [Sesbania bispinosa]
MGTTTCVLLWPRELLEKLADISLNPLEALEAIKCITLGSCIQCYCQEKFLRKDDGMVSWKCEDCAPNDPKCGSKQLRKSERISHATEAKYNRMKMQMERGAVRKQKSVRSSKGESAECLKKNGIEKRKPIIENEGVLYEEPESLKGPLNISSDKQVLESGNYVDPETIMSQHLYSPEFDKYSRAQPLSDPVGTVQFRFNTTHFRLVVYMSSKACSKVHSAVTGLPKLLDVEMYLRCVIWPQSFDMFPPDGDSIGLYFFPQFERDEMVFDNVLKDAIEQDLAFKADMNNVQLLIFSSHILPPDDRRICQKYYLWGAFKPQSRSGNTQSNQSSSEQK